MFGRRTQKTNNNSSDSAEFTLDGGYQIVKSQGVDSAIRLIEEGKSEFKAAVYIKVYDTIFKMCIQREPHNFSAQLYDKYSAEIKAYCVSTVTPALRAAAAQPHDSVLLATWGRRWANVKLVIRSLQRLFSYLDRFHTKSQDNIKQLTSQAYHIYKAEVFDTYASQVRDAIIRCIERERNEEDCDRKLLKEAVVAFEEMGAAVGTKLALYRSELETNLVSQAREFYRRISRNWIQQDSASEYLRKAERMLSQERGRVDSFLNAVTLTPLTNACYDEMLKKHQTAILDKKTGLDFMLLAGTPETDEDLARMFSLFHESEWEPMATKFFNHVSAEGKKLVDKASAPDSKDAKGSNESKDLVANLINLQDRYAGIVSQAFQSHQIFQRSLRKGFEDFINLDERVANLLAEYSDLILKKGSKIRVESANLDTVLQNIAYLYYYINDKDSFERAYQMLLQRRLLQDEFDNEHSEKQMIVKLKHSNFQFTNRLEGMFKDRQTSKTLVTSFLAADGKKFAGNIQLEIHVCTTSHWPRPEGQSRALMPTELKEITESYSTFYYNQNPGHRLEYRMDKGTAEVTVRFHQDVSPYILMVSTYQMILLLMFNSASSTDEYKLEYDTILDRIGLESGDIGHHLLSLCHPKHRILRKLPKSIQLSSNDTFHINPEFTQATKRVNVHTMTPPDQIKKKDAFEAKHRDRRRRTQLECAIVRIMKARKTLKHNALLEEVVNQLKARFQPSPTEVKKRIESLIEAGYLERSATDRGIYQYLA
jgi:hypothetical protein